MRAKHRRSQARQRYHTIVGATVNSRHDRDAEVDCLPERCGSARNGPAEGLEIDGVTIWCSGQKGGVTRTIKQRIHRRNAIEPTIGNIKTDGKRDRNWLKDLIANAMHAMLCGAGRNRQLILNKQESSTTAPSTC